MTWNQTHRRYEILNQVEAELAREPGVLPWREEYAGLFAGPDGLVAALRYRWNLRLQAQLDPELDPAEQAAALARVRRDAPSLVGLRLPDRSAYVGAA